MVQGDGARQWCKAMVQDIGAGQWCKAKLQGKARRQGKKVVCTDLIIIEIQKMLNSTIHSYSHFHKRTLVAGIASHFTIEIKQDCNISDHCVRSHPQYKQFITLQPNGLRMHSLRDFIRNNLEACTI